MEKTFYLEKFDLKTSDMVFPPSYQMKGGKMRVWMSDGSFREGAIAEISKLATDQVMKLTLGSQYGTKTSRYDIKVEYKEGTDGTGLVPADAWELDKHKCIYTFLMQHPLCTVNKKTTPYTSTPLFNVVDVEAMGEDAIDLDDDKMTVKNMLKMMDFDELKDVCFYFGKSPKNKKEKDLRLLLSDWNTGILFSSERGADGKLVSNMYAFLELWSNPDKIPVALINAHKAVEYGIIIKKPEDNKYYYDTTFVGSDYERIVEWFDKEHDLYEGHIVKEIAKNDSYKVEKVATVEAEKVKAGKVESAKEVEDLRLKVIALKEHGHIPMHIPLKNMKLPKLKEWYEYGKEAEKKASEVAA